MLKLAYFLLVTLCYVESCSIDPSWKDKHRTVGIGHYKCWPKTINEQQVLGEFDQKNQRRIWNRLNFFFIFLVEHKLWKKDANRKAEEAIAEDPENTICERSWWIFQGWTIKCTRAPYRGLDCGSGVHGVMWSKNKYKWRSEFIAEDSLGTGPCGIS